MSLRSVRRPNGSRPRTFELANVTILGLVVFVKLQSWLMQSVSWNAVM